MNRKRRSLLPILFLLSCATIFLLSYTHHSTPPLGPSPPPHSPPPTFSFTIKLLAFDRLPSLRRCLLSLSRADYAGDRVHLHVFLDHFVPSNASDLVDRKLEESRRILEFVDGFAWEHGEKVVHYRTGNVGLQAQWLEAWWPVSDDEFAFVVEDDLEVSGLYYRYLKGLIGRYYYDKASFSPRIYGASLQRPRFVPGKHGNKLHLDPETHIFLYQLVGTWGQLLFPKPWKEFRLWYDSHKSKGIKPFLPGMVTTGWYKKMGERIWTPWFIKFIHSRGYYNIYTNFQGERALSISHRDAGVNYGKSAGPDSFLIDGNSLDFNLWELPPLRNLKWYDFCFREVLPGRVVRSFNELNSVLPDLQTQKPVILVSLYRTPERVIRNLLCHLERLNIQNYVLIGADSELLLDLAGRGHPVVDANEVIRRIHGFRPSGLQSSDSGYVKEILVKAFVIKRCLEQGYNTWLVDGNMVPLTDAFLAPSDTSYNFLATKETEFMFARASQSSVSYWSNDFIRRMVKAASSFADSHTISQDQRHFVYFAIDALKRGSGAGALKDDVSNFVTKFEIGSTNASLGDGKMLCWKPDMGVDLVQKELRNWGMWSIDGDSSCTAVVCHQS